MGRVGLSCRMDFLVTMALKGESRPTLSVSIASPVLLPLCSNTHYSGHHSDQTMFSYTAHLTTASHHRRHGCFLVTVSIFPRGRHNPCSGYSWANLPCPMQQTTWFQEQFQLSFGLVQLILDHKKSNSEGRRVPAWVLSLKAASPYDWLFSFLSP